MIMETGAKSRTSAHKYRYIIFTYLMFGLTMSSHSITCDFKNETNVQSPRDADIFIKQKLTEVRWPLFNSFRAIVEIGYSNFTRDLALGTLFSLHDYSHVYVEYMQVVYGRIATVEEAWSNMPHLPAMDIQNTLTSVIAHAST